MLVAALVLLVSMSFVWSKDNGNRCPPLRRTETEDGPPEAELSTFPLREVPNWTEPVVYDVCSEEKNRLFFLHFRRGGGTTLDRFFRLGKCNGRMYSRFETYEGYFTKHRCWSLDKVFLLKEPAFRPVTGLIYETRSKG